MPDDSKNAGFGLYIHWPFCLAKCPYCDFNSHVSQNIDQRVWADAYVKEIGRVGAETGDKILGSVFFGGGTPSLMEPETVDRIMDAVRRTWRMTNDAEVTLEANPTSVEAGRFQGYAAAGVNRLSMGIQALNDEDLRRLGRMHSAEEAMRAFDIARAQFDRVSFDLIYARQDQTVANWERELGRALDMAVDHLSLYQLTIEDGTAFGDRYKAGKLRGLPNEDLSADMWDLTQALCADRGFPAYEVSNHAKSDRKSQHNLVYWRYGDYVGIGPGAHGRLTLGNTRWATECPKAPGKWLEMVSKGSGESPRDALALPDQLTEFLLMGMRLTEGVAIDRLAAFGDMTVLDRSKPLIDQGFLSLDEGRLKATSTGMPVLNAVLRDLLGG